MKNLTPIVHLLSGGIDSTVMLYDLHSQGHPVHCLIFNYHQNHSKELTFAAYHCGRLGVPFTEIIIPTLKGSTLTDGAGSVVVPNRNAIMLSFAVNVAAAMKAPLVTFAANADDEANFPDCRKAFVAALNATLKAAEVRVEVCAPYLDKLKWEILAIGQNLAVPLALAVVLSERTL